MPARQRQPGQLHRRYPILAECLRNMTNARIWLKSSPIKRGERRWQKMVRRKTVGVRLAICLLTALALNSPAQRTARPATAPVTFVEVDAKSSGITWIHNNA